MSTSGQRNNSILIERDESSDVLAPLPSDISRLMQGELGFTGKRYLPYRRPTEPYRGGSRISSMPETLPPSKVRADQPGSRATSASAVLVANSVAQSSQGDYSIDSIVSSYTDRSLSTSSYRSSSGSTRAYEFTPSPPSSPESSIMIVNDGVDESTLFQPYGSGKVSGAHMVQDEDGWITMAHSPPRAIPALHGPTSLPYARCPSGAEGTIMEGKDYSRMIWGLGSSQVSSNQRQAPAVPSVHVANKEPVSKEPTQRQTYEDLDKARSPISLPGNPLYQSLPREMIGSRQTYSPYLDYRRVPDNTTAGHVPSFQTAHVTDSENDLRTYSQHGSSFSARLPYQRSVSMTDSGASTLKLSAPVFVPTLSSALSENAPGKSFSQHLKGRTSLPTPPSSAEPLWSSSFSAQHPVPALSAKALSLLGEIERAAISHEESEQLRNLVLRELGGMNLDDDAHVPIPFSARRTSLDSSYAYRSNLGISPHIRDPLPPPHTYHEREKMELPPTPPAADEAQLAGSRQPRSVPFARMMERRRLSTNENVRPEEISAPPNTPASTQPSRRLSQSLQPIEPIHASLYPRAPALQTSQNSSSRASSPTGTGLKSRNRRSSQEQVKPVESGQGSEGRWSTAKKTSKSKAMKAAKSKKPASVASTTSTVGNEKRKEDSLDSHQD